MGIVKKQNIQTYWSTDDLLNTPFVCNTMSHDEFLLIMSFFHLTDNSTYSAKGEDGYNPRRKLGLLFTSLTESFAKLWTPRKMPSIDEGCIPFKGIVSFKCYNPKKIE